MALFLIIYIWKLLINDSPSRSLIKYLPWQFSFSKLLYQLPFGITFDPVRQFTFSHRLPHSIAVETISLSCLSSITSLAIFASLFVLFSSPESVTATSHHAYFWQELYWTMLFGMFRASSEACEPCSVILVGKRDSCHNSTTSLENRNKLSNV